MCTRPSNDFYEVLSTYSLELTKDDILVLQNIKAYGYEYAEVILDNIDTDSTEVQIIPEHAAWDIQLACDSEDGHLETGILPLCPINLNIKINEFCEKIV